MRCGPRRRLPQDVGAGLARGREFDLQSFQPRCPRSPVDPHPAHPCWSGAAHPPKGPPSGARPLLAPGPRNSLGGQCLRIGLESPDFALWVCLAAPVAFSRANCSSRLRHHATGQPAESAIVITGCNKRDDANRWDVAEARNLGRPSAHSHSKTPNPPSHIVYAVTKGKDRSIFPIRIRRRCPVRLPSRP
jgi:hypothetical protein